MLSRLLVCVLLACAAFAAPASAAVCPGADPCPYTGFSYVGAHSQNVLDFPYDVAVDGQGNVYVVTERPGVEKFSPSAFALEWGTKGSDDNQFQLPTGVAVDGEGNVYVADANNSRVQKFTSTGDLLARWGGGFGAGDTTFAGPYRVAVDGAGNLYVADSFNDRVVKRGPDGEVLGVWTEGFDGTAISGPQSIAVDSAAGVVYVTGAYGQIIHRLQASDGTALEPVTGLPTDFENPQAGQFEYADDLAVDPVTGDLFVLSGAAVHQRSAGSWTARIPVRGGKGLTVAGGSLYIADQGTLSVRKYSLAGELQQTFGAPVQGEVLAPEGTAVDGEGNLWVADTGADRIQKFGPDDASLGMWGTTGTGPGEFSNPRSVAALPSGDVLVADTGNRRLQQLAADGEYVREWDLDFDPDHVAVDADGHAYVADTQVNNLGMVRRLTLADDGTYAVDFTIGSSESVPSAQGGVAWPRGVAVDGEHLYVADDRQDHMTSDDPGPRIKKYRLADGAFVANWSTTRAGDQADAGNIRGVAVMDGSVYAVDSGTYQVRKFSSSTGEFQAGWGQSNFPSDCPGKFSFVEGISAGNGSVYVSDTILHQIQRFKLSGGALLECDSTPPDLDAITPATNATVGGSPAFSGTAGTAAGDHDTVTVRLFGPGPDAGYLKVLRRFTADVQDDGTWSVTPPTPLEDGAYRFEAEQDDDAGHAAITTMRPFTISGSAGGDQTPPDVAVVFPSPAGTTVTVDNTPALRGTGGTATGDAATVSVSLYRRTDQGDTKIKDFPALPLAGGDWTAEVTDRLSNGTYAVQATQRDEAENTGDTGKVEFRVSAPRILAPAEDAATNDDTPTISGTAASYPGAAAALELEIRNQAGQVVTQAQPNRTGITWEATLSALPDGTYTAVARHADATGAQGVSPTRTFRIDTRRPSIGQSRPVNKTNTVDHTPLLSGTAGTREGDETAIQIEYRKWNGTDWEAPKWINATRDGGKWEVEAPFLEDGTWFTRAYQWDSAGNWGSSAGTQFGVYTDSTPPAPTINSPEDNGYVPTQRPTLSGAAGSAAGDLTEIRVEIYRFRGTGWEFVRWEKAQRSGNGWTHTFNSDLEVGSWFVRAYQSDEAGNTGYSSGTVFNIDQFAPKGLTIDRPGEGATVNNTFSLAGAASGATGDLDYIELELQKYENGVYTPLAGSPFRVTRSGWTWSFQRTLPNGTYFARIYQGDRAGNAGHSGGRLFKVQAPPPPPGQDAGSGVGEAGCQKSLTFGPIAVKGACLERVGLTWEATGTANTVDINGLRIVPGDANAKIILDPLNLRIAAKGRAKVQLGPVGACVLDGIQLSMCQPDDPKVVKVLGPVVLYEGEFEWVWQTKVRAGLPDIGGLEIAKILPDLSKFGLPKFEAPQLPSIPALNDLVPQLPKLPAVNGFKWPDLGKVPTAELPRFNIPSLDLPNVQIPNVLVPNFQLPPLCIGTGGGATGVFGMPLEGKACVALLSDRSGVEVTAAAKLPAIFGGMSGDTKLTVKQGLLRLDGLNIKVPEAWFGAVGFKEVGVSYSDATKLWEGGATIYLPPLGDAGIGATVGVQNGSLANLGVKWRPGNFAIGTTGLFLNEIGMGYRSVPSSEIFGNLNISAGPEVAGCAALQVKTNAKYNFSEVYFQINGRVYLACMEFAGADFEWHGNGYLWGKLAFTPPEVAGFGAKATIEGWVDRDYAFNLEGAGSFYGPGVSVGADAVISGDNRSWTDTYGGAAICGRINAGWFGKHEVGIGRTWDQSHWNILGGVCDIGPYRVEYDAVARAAQAGPQTVNVKAGEDVKVFGFQGNGAPPKVTLTGPDGLKVTTPAGPEGMKTDRVLLMQDARENMTHIVVGKPAAGAWRVELQPGSRPLTAVKGAEALPEPKVKASVEGRGAKRKVRWEIKQIPGQKVQFVEEGDGVARTIGLATRAKGAKTFTPGPSKDRSRDVWAIVLQNDVPRMKFKVGSYKAPSSRPTKPGRVLVKRRKTGLLVKWLPAARAKEYRVRVRSGGTTVVRSTKKRSVLIPNVGMFGAARVQVQGRSATGELGPSGKLNAKKPKAKKPRKRKRRR